MQWHSENLSRAHMSLQLPMAMLATQASSMASALFINVTFSMQKKIHMGGGNEATDDTGSIARIGGNGGQDIKVKGFKALSHKVLKSFLSSRHKEPASEIPFLEWKWIVND